VQPSFYLQIIFKTEENLDNNFIKTLEKAPFLGCAELSGILRNDPHFEKPTLWDFFIANFKYFPTKIREKKWHRSAKLDIYFCPFFKSPYKSL
jgi:hypothetical protein